MQLTDPIAARDVLAAHLRAARRLAGLRTRELATAIRISQTRVVRLEAGRISPTRNELDRWCVAADVPKQRHEELVALLEAAVTDTHRHRPLLRARGHVQDDVGRREAATTRLRVFVPGLVPGLLQTPRYATTVMEMIGYHSDYSLAAAVAARADRQRILGSPGHRVDIIVTEAALRWCPGPGYLLAEQLRHIRTQRTLPGVTVSVIPSDGQTNTVIPHGFTILSRPGGDFVTVELMHATVDVTDPVDVDTYHTLWDRLAQAAFDGLVVDALLEQIADSR